MQPLARLSHSVAVLEPEETVRGSSRSVVLPNSEGGSVSLGGFGEFGWVVGDFGLCLGVCDMRVDGWTDRLG